MPEQVLRHGIRKVFDRFGAEEHHGVIAVGSQDHIDRTAVREIFGDEPHPDFDGDIGKAESAFAGRLKIEDVTGQYDIAGRAVLLGDFLVTGGLPFSLLQVLDGQVCHAVSQLTVPHVEMGGAAPKVSSGSDVTLLRPFVSKGLNQNFEGVVMKRLTAE